MNFTNLASKLILVLVLTAGICLFTIGCTDDDNGTGPDHEHEQLFILNELSNTLFIYEVPGFHGPDTIPMPTSFPHHLHFNPMGGEYYVVVGSYGDPANAQRLVQRLDASGIAAEIFSGPGASGTLHRVRVGYFVDHSRAEAFGRKLQKDMSLDFWVGHR